MAIAKEQNQLPVRGKIYWPDRTQNNQVKKTFKYEYKTKNNPTQNKKNTRNIISSVGKTETQRYRSVEQQKAFQNRYQSYDSPLKKRGGFLAKKDNTNFNKKRWAYASKQDISKLILLQRWWRYKLKNPKFRKKRFSQKNGKNLVRSQSSQLRKSMDMTKLMKQGENITEKIFPGKNNNLIIETRKVEVFKKIRPKQPKTVLKAESLETKKVTEGMDSRQKYSELTVQSGDFTKKMYQGKYNTLTAEARKGTKIKIGDAKQRYENIRKEGENITEKIFPGKDNTLINEKRTVEVFKVHKPKTKQEIRVSSKESERHAQSLTTSKQKYEDIRKEGESLTDKIFPGKDSSYLIDERRKVEVYKTDKSKSKTKQDMEKDLREKEKGKYIFGSKDTSRYTESSSTRKKWEKSEDKKYPGKSSVSTDERKRDGYGSRIDSREKGRYPEGVKDIRKYTDIKKEGESITEKVLPGQHDTIINERRKVEVFKVEKPKTKTELEITLKDRKSHSKSVKKYIDYDDIVKEGENITEKVFPGNDNSLIYETRKVEVFKSRRSKPKKGVRADSKEIRKYEKKEGLTESEQYQESLTRSAQFSIEGLQKTKKFFDIKGEKKIIRDQRKRKHAYYRPEPFVEEEGITRKYIKEKMAQIWSEEVRKINENKFSLFGNQRKNLFDTYRGGARGSPETKSEHSENVDSLLNTIQEKDKQLNKIVNQLKSQMSQKTQKYDQKTLPSSSKLSLKKTEKTEKSPTFDNYESKIRQLLNIIKEKDDKVNKLIQKLASQAKGPEGTRIYEYGKPIDGQKTSQDSTTKIYEYVKPIDGQKTSPESTIKSRGGVDKLRTQSYQSSIKNILDTNKSLDGFDTIHSQSSLYDNKNIIQSRIGKNLTDSDVETSPGDYQNTISHLRTVIREKDDELEKLVNQLNTDKAKKLEFTDLDLDCYGLGILTDKESWNDVVRVCPINNLYICDKKDWNENNEISQLDLSIMSLGKNWDDIVEEEGRDALFVEAVGKEPLEHQKIELLQINGQSILDKWLDEIQPNSEENLEISKTETTENVIDQTVGLTIYSMEKEENKIQNINSLYVEGRKNPWKNLSEDTITVSFEKTPKPENEIEARDSIEIMAIEKEPLVRQLIDALFVEGFEKAENVCELVQEVEIEKASKPENVTEQRDSIEITALEKEELIHQPINQLFIAAVIKAEFEAQRTQEMEIVKTPKPENEIDANVSIEIIGFEKEPLSEQLINKLTIEESRPENEEQRAEELELLKTQKPENSIDERDSIVIEGLEKEELSRQLINQLIIEGCEKPENEEQRTEEVELLKRIKTRK